jgi:cytochrome o ubiquinol oxidase subunit III
MTAIAAASHPESSRDEDVPFSERGPAPTDAVVGFGFWLFLLSDIVVFSALFAAYAVLADRTAGGPSGTLLFDRGRVLIETFCLLASSFSCGLMSLAIERRRGVAVFAAAAATFALGAGFLGLELSEFARMIAHGQGPSRSAFLSAFFTLVGAHGLHVASGLAWLLAMLAQVATLGFRPMVMRRMRCFALFWHALDIVWIGVFTIVYLGAR